MNETATTLQQQLTEAMAKRAAAVAGAKKADQDYLKALRIFDDDGAKELRAYSDQCNRERDRLNAIIHQINGQIEVERHKACAEEMAQPAAELRRLVRLTVDQAKACHTIAQKHGQGVIPFVLPPMPEGPDTPRSLVTAMVLTAVRVADATYGSGHPDHPSYVR